MFWSLCSSDLICNQSDSSSGSGIQVDKTALNSCYTVAEAPPIPPNSPMGRMRFNTDSHTKVFTRRSLIVLPTSDRISNIPHISPMSCLGFVHNFHKPLLTVLATSEWAEDMVLGCDKKIPLEKDSPHIYTHMKEKKKKKKKFSFFPWFHFAEESQIDVVVYREGGGQTRRG